MKHIIDKPKKLKSSVVSKFCEIARAKKPHKESLFLQRRELHTHDAQRVRQFVRIDRGRRA
ncbi:MAG: hypothetical protein HKP40_01495 [Litoreibacter sp.]|nr:hypothetical protein [Boseongicola sp.]NNK77363.1 hypothetical protein [Litoreibacter sp.]